MSEESGAPVAPEAPAQAVEAEDGQPVQNPAEQAPADPAEKPADTPELAAKREGRRFEKRLGTAIRRAAEATARAELLERQLAELKPKATSDPGAPKLEDFSDIEEYAKARELHAEKRKEREISERQQSTAQQREVVALTEAWEEKAARAEGKYDDFDSIVGDIKPTTPLLAAVMEAENAEDVAYYLGKNPKEAKRILELPVRAQIREIGKLEAKLLAEPTKPRTPSQAPSPIKPLGAAASPSTKKLSEMTQDEFEKKRKAQIAARR